MKRNCFYTLVLLFVCSATLTGQSKNSVCPVLDSLKHSIACADDRKTLAWCRELGLTYNMAGEYDSARIYLNMALSLPGGREYEGGRLITNLANSYGFEGRYAEALKHYMEALQVSERIVAAKSGGNHGQNNILRTVANLAEIHYLTGNRKQALHYAERGIKQFEEIFKMDNNVDYMVPQILYVLGLVYLDMNEPDRAEEAMRRTCELAGSIAERSIQKHGDPFGMWMYVAYGREGLARVCMARKDYAQALERATEALSFAEKHGDPTVTAKVLSVFSDIYLEQDNYAESGRFAQKATEQFPAFPDVNPGVTFNAAAASLFAGDKEEAYRRFRLYADRMKATAGKQFRETVAGMEVAYETEKKELRIADLERQKILYILIGIAAVLLAAMTWIIFRQKIRNSLREKQFIAANAVFEGEKRERERFARDLHDGVNGMLSAIRIELTAMEHLHNIRDRIDICIEEIRRLASGVMPVSLQRYGMKAALEDYCRSFPNVYFHYFGENRRIDEKTELVVYYSAYELVHNSVRHAAATAINVQLIQENKRISLTVQDDGCGYNGESSGQGVGLKSLRDRITAMNGKMEVISAPGNGTETMIELKI